MQSLIGLFGFSEPIKLYVTSDFPHFTSLWERFTEQLIKFRTLENGQGFNWLLPYEEWCLKTYKIFEDGMFFHIGWFINSQLAADYIRTLAIIPEEFDAYFSACQSRVIPIINGLICYKVSGDRLPQSNSGPFKPV